jgi:DNA-binding response OmpR family regulator
MPLSECVQVSRTLKSRFPGTETILIAEDMEDIRELVAAVFEGSGYSVIRAGDGEDAVEQFRESNGEVDLVIMDVAMPKKNGIQAYREIRKLRPGMKVLFISGYPDSIISERELLASGAKYLAKPFSLTELMSGVREILDEAA